MHGYKIYLIFIYLFGIRWSFCTPETPKTVVNYNLRRLKQFGNTSEVSKDYRVTVTTFTPGDTHSVAKVFYDTHDVWTLASAEGKTVKSVVVTEKSNLLQLVHLVLQTTTGESTTEDVYYKKQKTEFTKLDKVNYNRESNRLISKQGNYVDTWFLFDFDDKDSYSRVVSFSKTLLDGVWKSVYSFSAKPYVFKYQGSPLWSLSNDANPLTQLEKYDLDDTTSLLLLNLATSDNQYFLREGATGPWKPLGSSLEFDTKVKEFKSRYFTTELEFQLATHPDYKKFVVNRSPLGHNVSDLMVHPLPNYFFNKVKFNDQELWSSTDKAKRVFRMKLTLLSHEVKLVHLFLTKGETQLTPESESLYFHKDASNTFKPLDKTGYRNALSHVKSLADKTAPFTYNHYWLQKEASLDLFNFNELEFTATSEEGKDGVVTRTLTPKEGMTFSKVSFNNLTLWPLSDSFHNPVVKKVVLVSKNKLLQMVHVVGTKTSGPNTNDVKEDNCFAKKDKDSFFLLEDQTMFDNVKAFLEEQGNLVDKTVHLDVNDMELNPQFFTVTTEYADGVHKRVVTVNNLKVTKLTNYTTELWVNRPEPTSSYLTKFEMYSFKQKKLLKAFVTTEHRGKSEVFFAKEDEFTAFVEFSTNFNEKLLNFKMPSSWEELSLDVAVKPNPEKFEVVVETLTGNRTKLTLTPLAGKKLTSVGLGAHPLFTSTEEKRVHKLEMYLEAYEAKFLKLYVWKDDVRNVGQLTVEGHYKSGTEWVTANFEEKLKEFLAQVSQVAFTYNPDWEVPPAKFDPHAFDPKYFNSVDELANAVKTTTYTPKEGTVVNEVTLDGANVWLSADGKKMVSFKVVSKNDMVQLLHLNVVTTAAPPTATDLFFKKVEDRYESLTDLSSFNALKTSLDDANTYVDDKVKLDLSSTAETSTKLFDKETTLEDGVEKTVVVVKAGKLFEVRASPPLWKSTDGSYVTKLERYVMEDTQFLVLHVQYPAGKTETLYFEKPVVVEPPPAPPAPEPQVESSPQQPLPPVQPASPDGVSQPAGPGGEAGTLPAGPGAPGPEGQGQQQLPQQPADAAQAGVGVGGVAAEGVGAAGVGAGTGVTSGHTTTTGDTASPPSPPSAPSSTPTPVPAVPTPAAKPSFSALLGKAAFFEKLNKAKAAVKHTEVTLNVTTYQSDEHFELHKSQEGTAQLFKLYPKKTFWARGLFNGNTRLWEQEKEGERMVEAFLYLHEGKVKFVRGVVWEKDHTDQSEDKMLHFQLVDGAYVAKEKAEFDTALQALTTVEPTPLKTQTVEQPPPTPYVFNKLFLSQTVDTNVFDVSTRLKYEHTLKTYTPKEDKFINLVETQHGVLWKAEEEEVVMRDAHFILKDNVALGHLTLKDNAQLVHLFFKFERQAWKRLTSDQYVDLHTKFYDGQSLTALLG